MQLLTFKAFPYSANTKSVVSYILEFINLVGRPNCLKCGSIECENVLNVSNPLYKTIV